MIDESLTHDDSDLPLDFPVIALAASTGGLNALSRILSELPADFPGAVLVVQHRSAREPNLLVKILQARTPMKVKSAEEGDVLRTGMVYVAVPDWHLLVTPTSTLSLVQSEKVKYVRPAADPLFLSMASSLKTRAVVVVLTGHDGDGSGGVGAIQRGGGLVIAQEAATAEVPSMPKAAIATGDVDRIVPLRKIAATLISIVEAKMRIGSSR
jgi:two-component system, chemotaxis family, protein-glutamate methylesterase/glutaminase